MNDTRDGLASRKTSLRTEIIAGLTLFSAMAYAIVIIPEILSQGGFPKDGTTLAFLFVAAISTLVAGAVSRHPLALAAGVATAVAARDTVLNTNLEWYNALVCTSIAGVFVFICSILPLRLWLLKTLPQSIMNAVRAGIGALLANAALEEIVTVNNGAKSLVPDALSVFIPALIVVVICYAVIPRYLKHDSNKTSFIQHSSFLWGIVVGMISVFISAPVDFVEPITVASSWSSIAGANSSLGDISAAINNSIRDTFFNADKRGNSIILIVAFFFIMISDIAGSPYDFYLSGGNKRHQDLTESEEKGIQAGFLTDSIATSVAGIIGVTPQVFYAENHASWKSGGRTWISSFVVCAGFLILMLCAFFWGSILTVPKIVVSAPLFFVGLIIISDSLTVNTDDVRGRVTQEPRIDEDLFHKLVGGDRVYWIPAAATITATSVVALEYSILIGILAYLIFVEPLERAAGRQSDEKYLALALWTFVGFIPAVTFLLS